MTFYGKLTGALCAAAVIGTAAAGVLSESAAVLARAEALADECTCYVIGEYDGKVALFREGEEQPAAVYSTPITQINPADAELILKGIRIRGMTEAARLLEDLDVE